MVCYQYDLFTPLPTEEELRQKQIDDLSKQLGNVRRGTFSRIGDQAKLIMKQQETIEDQQRQIDQLRKMIMEIGNK